MASIKRIDHVAIAVKDVDQAVAQYQGLLNATHVRTEVLVEKAGPVRVAYMQIGENIASPRWKASEFSSSLAVEKPGPATPDAPTVFMISAALAAAGESSPSCTPFGSSGEGLVTISPPPDSTSAFSHTVSD